MKKKIIIILGVFAICIVSFAVTFFPVRHVSPSISISSPSVSVTFDTGNTIATVSGVRAQNAFQALQEAAKKQHLPLQTKQYDFGIFVEQIGVLANTKEKSWIYFVNGKSGEVAADTYKVKTGDTVEWKYTTPIY